MPPPDDSTATNEFLSEFLDEANEHLEMFEAGLLQLEETTEPGGELVGTLFRAMHSLKGAAGFLDLADIVSLSHAAENLLSNIREGITEPTSDHVDALLTTADLLRVMLAHPCGEPPQDFPKTLAALQSATAAAHRGKPLPAASPSRRDETACATSGVERTDSFASDIPDEYRALHTNGNLYLLWCDADELLQRGAANLLVWAKELSGTGNVLGLHCEGEWIDFDPGLFEMIPLCRFSLALSSLLEKDMVAIATLLDHDGIHDLSHSREVTSAGNGTHASAAAANRPDIGTALPVARSKPDPTPLAAPEEPATEPAPSTDTPSGPSSAGRTVRISVELMDTIMALAGELVLVRNQQLALVDRTDTRLRDNVQRLDMVTSQLQEAIMLTRMQPIGNLFDKFPRIVRDLGRRLQKEILLDVIGRDVEIDKIILENLSDPMTHLIRNACDHGIEAPDARMAAGKTAAGTILIRAFQEGGQILIEIRDDGRGIDVDRVKHKALEQGLRTAHELERMTEAQTLALIMVPGFSTVEKVSEISGRGVGMDVVQSCIEAIGGTIGIQSKSGLGTRILLRLPLTLAIIPSLIVKSGGDRFAIPQVSLEELVSVKPDGSRGRIEMAHLQESFRLRDRLLPVVRLGELLSTPRGFTDDTRRAVAARYDEQRQGRHGKSTHIAIVKTGADRYGLVVDEILGTEEIVVKPLHPSLKRMPCFSGCTIMGDGRVALILDIDGITKHADLQFTNVQAKSELSAPQKHAAANVEETHDVFLFKYGADETFAVPLTMVQRIETISAAEIQRVGSREFVTRGGVSTYVLRLDRMLGVSSPQTQPDTMYLIMSKYIRRPVGILVTSIIDTIEARILFREDSYLEDGLLGSMPLNGQMTLFLDIFRLVEKAEPEWFGKRPLPPAVQNHRRVLLVEDAEFFRHIVRRYLEDGGFEVVTAVNGRDALMHMSEEEFDIVVSDLVMPEMDGWSLAEEIRRRTRRRKMPLLALSSLQDENDRAKALQSGFDRYVPKFDREAFLSSVLELLAGANAPDGSQHLLEQALAGGQRP